MEEGGFLPGSPRVKGSGTVGEANKGLGIVGRGRRGRGLTSQFGGRALRLLNFSGAEAEGWEAERQPVKKNPGGNARAGLNNKSTL